MSLSSYPFSALSYESRHLWGADFVHELPAEPLNRAVELPDTPEATFVEQSTPRQDSEPSEIGSSELCWPLRPACTPVPAEHVSAQTVSSDSPAELPTSNPEIVSTPLQPGNIASTESHARTAIELESSLRDDQERKSNPEPGDTASTSALSSSPLRMRESPIGSKT